VLGVPGIDNVGPLPAPLQAFTTVSANVATGDARACRRPRPHCLAIAPAPPLMPLAGAA